MQAPEFSVTKTPDLEQSLLRSLPGVSLRDETGNQFQLDLNYRGFTASPVDGTPQGLAVYQNGVRINEVFGDIVNWDFIPQNAGGLRRTTTSIRMISQFAAKRLINPCATRKTQPKWIAVLLDTMGLMSCQAS